MIMNMVLLLHPKPNLLAKCTYKCVSNDCIQCHGHMLKWWDLS